jgi:hypothetical protein
MDFTEQSARWLDSLDLGVAAPGFAERLAVAAGRASGARSLAAPYYLTDLGIRRFEDPELFLSGHLELFTLDRASDLECDDALLRSVPLDRMGSVLDSFILMTGAYEAARDVVLARLEEIVADGAPGLLVQTGVLLAALGDGRARSALDRAATIAIHPTDRFMASHRLAAAEIKRFQRPEVGVRILANLDGMIDDAERTGAISAGDRELLLSVTANLRALALILLGRGSEVRAEILRSRHLHTLDDLREVAPGEAARYGSQERINLAQVLSGDGEMVDAVSALAENLSYCRSVNHDYIGEALTALAYGQFRAELWTEAATTAAEAAHRIAFEASPARLRGARELQAASLDLAGDPGAARAVLSDLREDPLGLRLSRPGTEAGAR